MVRIILNKPPVARTALGIEDHEIEGALSPADELDSAVQMTELAASANDNLAVADDLADRAEALTDVVAVAETTPESTENDLALTEIVADLATRGTELVAEEHVVPGLESYLGKSIGVEGLKETIQSMWKALMEFLKNAWENVKAFFGNVESQISTLKKKLRDAARNVSDSKVSEDKAKSKGFCLGGKAPGSATELVKNLDETKSVLDKLLRGYSTVVMRHVETVNYAFYSQDFEKRLAGVDNLYSSFETVIAAAKPLANAEILGNVKLSLDELPLEKDGEMTSQVTKFKFDVDVETGSAGAAAFDITVEQKKAVYDRCLALLDIVDDFRRNKMTKFEMTIHQKLSMAVLDKSAGLAAKASFDDKAQVEGMKDALKYIANIGKATARFTQTPFTKVVAATLASIRTHVSVLDVEGAGKEVAAA